MQDIKQELKFLFDNLYNNKLIYRESGVYCICDLVSYQLDEDRFSVELTENKVLRPIDKDIQFTGKRLRDGILKLGSTYYFMDEPILNDKEIGRPYCPYTLWLDPILVEKFDKMNFKEYGGNIQNLLAFPNG